MFDWSAHSDVALSHDPNNPAVLKGVGMQVVWYLVGAAAIVVIMHLNSKWIWKLTPYLYGLGLVVMGLLLKFYDQNLAASRRVKNWIRFGGVYIPASGVDEDCVYLDDGLYSD